MIRYSLKKAGVGYEALDKEGKKTADEMKAILDFHSGNGRGNSSTSHTVPNMSTRSRDKEVWI